MALDIYSPADITVLLGGVVKLSGYLDGTFLEVSKDIQPYVSEMTSDDVTSRLYRRNRNYTIRFSIAQSSEANESLSELQLIDETTQLGMFPILIKDHSGSSLLFAPTAWIEGIPSQTFSNGMEGRTWEIKAANCVSFVGGNTNPDSTTRTVVRTILSVAPNLDDLVNDIGGLF
jgi:hypothetical protein